MAVIDRIREVIEERGLKQKALARRLGEPEYWLSNRLAGRTVLKADDVPRIARALGLRPADLFPEEGAGPETTPPGADVFAAIARGEIDLPPDEIARLRTYIEMRSRLHQLRDAT
jgi:transcriptional regulator with XRE-family HTH domain